MGKAPNPGYLSVLQGPTPSLGAGPELSAIEYCGAVLNAIRMGVSVRTFP